MSRRTRLARLEDFAAEKSAEENSCICRLVFLYEGQPQTEEDAALLKQNARCRSTHNPNHYKIIDIVPVKTED
jgi:hypothetical protein